ncbi:acyl-CoA thioesterase [Oceanobacillus kimchii]|uniref:Acyl-CoA thioester hydrolase YkhA n=1 Tax=Oceanobacillus kimchii TaxID=746691 RepID=A0ABQ5TMN3_9BACI|nr:MULTISPECIES: acyl-CoA thioesterase [Oceanobacillus]MBT2599508.1 acyl-CoA thioesterase [Oceanobacillus sp. ISL-74]MCT1576694.1 acyl-CoA thioesterase [Oceanobacillus kimchii]MCT2134764.1 acyl-CoA thioesterase [Oceanobacillus kimchii]OEH56062.1 acyl-CoA thioesterase [Oceanobacillus sp. E9]GLO67730.1 putative acyl-CoA thioester hydrolase YkhA [Oceanobacillus kimchii]
MKAKPCSASLAIKTTHVLPPDTNPYDTLFGGKLMAHLDDIAGIAAVKHANNPVVTASTDSVDFLAPVRVGQYISIEAFVTWTHKTSMEVFIRAITEDIKTGKRKACTTAFMTFVAIDENGKPISVPPVYPENDDEKMLHESAPLRANRREERRLNSKKLAETFGTTYRTEK